MVHSYSTFLSALLREERKCDGKDHHADDGCDEDEGQASLGIILEGVTAGGNHHGVGGHTDGRCVSAGAADDTSHQDCAGVGTHALCDAQADGNHQSGGCGVGHEVGHDAAEQEDHQSQDVGRGILAQSTNDDVCNLCACPGLIQCRGQRQRTTEEEDGLEVDRLQGVFLGDDTGEDQSQRTDTAGDAEFDANLLFKNHAQQGEHEDDKGEHLFPLGNIAEVLLAAEGVIIGDGVVGQKLHAKGGIEEDADGEDGQAHDGVLEEAEGHPDLTQSTLGDEVARCADEGKVAAHGRCKYQRHQQLGAGIAGLCRNADDHGDQDGGGTGVGKEAAHQANDDHDGHDEAALRFGKVGNNATDLVGHACFKQGTADNEHGDEQDDVAVDEARKSGLDVQHAGDDQTDTDDHGRYTEGDLLKHEHDDREEKKE